MLNPLSLKRPLNVGCVNKLECNKKITQESLHVKSESKNNSSTKKDSSTIQEDCDVIIITDDDVEINYVDKNLK